MSGKKLNSLFVALAAVAFVSGNGAVAQADEAHEKEVVEYRLQKWKTIHFHDVQKAKTHFDALKKLGCEVKQGDHDGHIGVTYRCAEWKKISPKTHSNAHKWEEWLKKSGFETKHVH